MSVEVRSCSKCGQASVIVVFEWQHTTFGAATGAVTRELRCQSCGAWHVVRPRSHVITWWVVGGILTLFTCVGGVPFFVLAWMRSGVEKSIPVVPGAPVPPMRFPGGPPVRRCGRCSSIATTVRVTRNTHNGIPTGTEWEYQCQACGTQFVVESAWGMIFSTFASSAVVLVAAAFFFYAESPGWRWGGTIVSLLLTLVLFAQVGARLANRFRHPVSDAPNLSLR